MKRAKIMLSVVAILALVGGAFAFKAQRFQTANVWTTSRIVGNIPYCTTAPFVTTNVPGFTSTFYTTTLANNVCTGLTTSLITVED